MASQARGRRPHGAPLVRFVRAQLFLALLGGPLLLAPARAQCRVGLNYAVNTNDRGALGVGASISRVLRTGASAVKIWGADAAVLSALQGQGVGVVVGVQPANITTAWARDPRLAQLWLDANIVPWASRVAITTIAVANEQLQHSNPDRVALANVVGGMWALHNALVRRGLDGRIKVKTPQHPGTLTNVYPVSRAEIEPAARQPFNELLRFVSATGSSLFVSIYPFYPYKDVTPTLNKDMIFFRGFNGYYDTNGLYYQNQFDMMVDSFLVAAEKLNYFNVKIEVAETGWPSAGSSVASVSDAREWNSRLLGKLCSGQGTPKYRRFIPFYIFEAFDEPWKGGGNVQWEANWGLMTLSGTPKYDLNFRASYPVPPLRPPPTWCVVRGGADARTVSGSVDWACRPESSGGGGVDCTTIYSRCPRVWVASAVYNSYFQRRGQVQGTCGFTNTANMVTSAPAVPGGCPMLGRPPGAPA